MATIDSLLSLEIVSTNNFQGVSSLTTHRSRMFHSHFALQKSSEHVLKHCPLAHGGYVKQC